jgi:hypothetical protein
MFKNFVENKKPKEGDLQVWHIPQVPGAPFEVAVSTPQEGKRVMAILAAYDLFQFHYNIKPDYSNAQGLNVFEDGEWLTWYDVDGNDIDELEINEMGELVYG